MEIRHLLYFKSVAEHLHFRKAAAALFISQPPLSRQIRELEEELQVQLFIRDNKQVVLTDAGKYFKEEVDALLSRLEESKNVARQIHLNVSGELRIGYISSLYQPQLAEVLKRMRGVFPYVKTRLYELPTVKQVEALELGKLDVGILRAPVHSDKLSLKPLFFDPFTVVVPGTVSSSARRQRLLSLSGTVLLYFSIRIMPLIITISWWRYVRGLASGPTSCIKPITFIPLCS